ncbi:MAG: hypothetical protein EVJ48_01870 [Candidatus Acidulodesulfobacterium acidiphilum]|uniref:TrwC relaxase domain-containing protein n=1 Tax=Candidatus Acidulodesulfobacterium acidiphilum TaxID=2597224 RepID=A0A520XGM2_9DELT|nr:MAG: hypothetical protein EVJ48_01870 [Candidatus Acidulodesulfobacterium acidiphilum]
MNKMLSAGKQYQNYEYYAKDPIFSVEEGHFIGGLAAELGFKEMNKETFEKLQAGQNAKGEQIIEMAQGKHDPGKDFTFSLDKDLSIFMLSSEQNKVAMQNALNAAVDKIIDTAISEGFLSWREHKGDQIIDHKITDKNQIAAYGFTQSLSRDNDPNVHAHIAFFNQTKTENGDFRAISFDGLFTKGAREYLDNVGKNTFLDTLQKGINKDISSELETNKKTGAINLKSYSQEDRDYFSKRSQEIEKAKIELQKEYPNASKGEISQMANKLTRNDKDFDFKKEDLDKELEKVKGKTNAIEANIELSMSYNKENNLSFYKTKLVSSLDNYMKALTQKEIYSSKNSLFTEVLKENRYATIENVKQVYDEYLKNGKIEERDLTTKNGQTIKTFALTEDLKAAEEIYKMAANGRGNSFTVGTKEENDKIIAQFEKEKGFILSPQQREAVEKFMNQKDQFNFTQGFAGAGKTTAFELTKRLAENSNFSIVGFANNGSQAQNLMNESGIKSQTMASFIASETKNRQGEKALVIIDEASMTGLKTYSEFYKKLNDTFGANNWKTSLTGDTNQLQSIGKGRVFNDNIENSENKTVISDIRRQKNETLKSHIYEYYEQFEKNKIDGQEMVKSFKDYIKVVKKEDDILKEAVKTYMSFNKKESTVILVRTNEEKNILNAEIRKELSQQGILKGKDNFVGTLTKKNIEETNKLKSESYEKGDIISFRKSEYKEISRTDDKNNLIYYKSFVYKNVDKNVKIDEEKNKVFIKDKKSGLIQSYDLRNYDKESKNVSYFIGKNESRLNLSENSEKTLKIQKYEENKISLKKNDKVIFTENINLINNTEKTVKYIKASDQSLLTQKILKADKNFNRILDEKKFNKEIAKAEKLGAIINRVELKNKDGKLIGESAKIVYEEKKELKNGQFATFVEKKGNIYNFKVGENILSLDKNNKSNAAALQKIEHAYAVTTDKAQGLAFLNVVSVGAVKKTAQKILVDITRAIKNLVLIVSEKSMEKKELENGKLGKSDLEKAFENKQEKTTLREETKKEIFGNSKNIDKTEEKKEKFENSKTKGEENENVRVYGR